MKKRDKVAKKLEVQPMGLTREQVLRDKSMIFNYQNKYEIKFEPQINNTIINSSYRQKKN